MLPTFNLLAASLDVTVVPAYRKHFLNLRSANINKAKVVCKVQIFILGAGREIFRRM